MDLMTGLAAVSQALGIAKDLREIDRSINEAEFKLKLAELQTALADAKIALSDARLVMAEKDEEISCLKSELDAVRSGDVCPICKTGRLNVVGVRDHGTFGIFGVKEHDTACSNSQCGHRETRIHDPRNQVAGMSGTRRR